MVERELSTIAPFGGIIADSMGLGKTIQTIATMVANPPISLDIARGVKATLIVCPATIVNQWIDEIATHAGGFFKKVLHYKTSAKIPLEIIQDCDVVITSYHEVMKQFPFPDSKARQLIARNGHESWWRQAINDLGVLHKIKFLRIVLDEAHFIKNNNARTSLACQNLQAIYRWALTGTPLMNRLEELFPYLRFLKASFTISWQVFKEYFCDPNSPDCVSRIATLLSYTMIRRTMNTSILGRPIISLPKPHSEIRMLDFSPMEKIIYRITENRFRVNLNKYFEQGDAQRHYGCFLLQLLRLRMVSLFPLLKKIVLTLKQATSSPLMLERTIRDMWSIEDVQALRLRLSRLNDEGSSGPFYEQVKVWVGQPSISDETTVLPFGQGDFGHSFKFGKALDTLNETEMMERLTCGICSDFPVNAQKTPVSLSASYFVNYPEFAAILTIYECQHIFCNECLQGKIHEDLATQDYMICPVCDKMFDKFEPLSTNGASFFDEEDMGSLSSGGSSRRSNKNKSTHDSKGLDLLGHEPATDSTWVPQSDYVEGFALTPSAKTTALKAILLQVFHETDDKVSRTIS